MNTPNWDTLTLDETIEQLKAMTKETQKIVYPQLEPSDNIYEFLEAIEASQSADLMRQHEVSFVDRYGGMEGFDDDEYWVIVQVGSRHIKISGWYSSWTGSEIEWSNAHFVEEQPVTRTEWVRV